jgi:hypothetical protein
MMAIFMADSSFPWVYSRTRISRQRVLSKPVTEVMRPHPGAAAESGRAGARRARIPRDGYSFPSMIPGPGAIVPCDSSLVLQHRQTNAMQEGNGSKMSKPSYSRWIILLIPAALLAAYLGTGSLALRVDLELPLWLKVWCSAYIASMLHVTTMGLSGTFWACQLSK